MEQTGLNALPIVGLISFLVGVVLAYQGADQLARFGAQIFTVNLVAVGVLREMGILLTAIIVAGRSGSAFNAPIGPMKGNEAVYRKSGDEGTGESGRVNLGCGRDITKNKIK